MRRLPSSRRLDFCRRASAGALSALLAACGSAPVTHWHSLMPEAVPAAGAIAPAPAKEPIVVELEAVRLPTQVDQPQWLVRLPDGSLAVLEQERWASSLRDELRDALLETLIVRHGVVEAHEASRTKARPIRVAIDVRRFDSLPGREARIEGSWTLVGAELRVAPARCEWFYRENADGPPGALAGAHRRAVARLADGIGAALKTLSRGERPVCPAPDDAA